MKLAEALSMRADAQRRIAQLKQRAMMSARHQEGERPAEDPDELLAEAEALAGELKSLIRRINRTNTQSVAAVDVATCDAVRTRSREYRELDARIRAKNWEIDLLE